jgi:hypothetical protein
VLSIILSKLHALVIPSQHPSEAIRRNPCLTEEDTEKGLSQ